VQFTILAKLAVVGVLSLLLVPLGMVEGLIAERQGLRNGILRDMAPLRRSPNRGAPDGGSPPVG